MINFHYIRYKNFLSTGNQFTEINLRKSRTTLVVGQNGAGKSTLLDALSFALFGKAHRNISKPQMLNSVNGKHCEVHAEFSVSGKVFKIIRGIKPNKFEIWSDGKMLNQESHSRDYQNILEQNILKLNHKSFHQIVVLGSSSFVPFMQLAANHRREVIEDLLDIGVFSKMNMLLREKISIVKEKMRQNDTDLLINSNSIDSQKKYIKSITEINLANRENKIKSIEEKRSEIDSITKINAEYSKQIEDNLDPIKDAIDKLNDRKTKLESYKNQFQTEMRKIVKEAKFYEDNSECPTCAQTISEEVRDQHLSITKDRAKELQEGINQANETSESLDGEYNVLLEKQTEILELQKSVHSNINLVNQLTKTIEQLQEELNTLSLGTEDLSNANLELEKLRNEKEELSDIKYKLNEEQQYNTVIQELLKDTGIKTKIIKQYLPVINQLVNQYLQTLDFYVHFDLDESFKETIRSRHRDEFTYSSFSEGEKQRIDLALLFTWRMIARMKNSVATNLLILDETFDSSLDHDGIENLMKILNTLEDDTNTFVISHKGDVLDGKFADKIEFYKEKNFSKIKA